MFTEDMLIRFLSVLLDVRRPSTMRIFGTVCRVYSWYKGMSKRNLDLQISQI